jgi:hypothetical protein
MLKLVAALVPLVVLAQPAFAKPPQSAPGGPDRFVGFSTSTVLGNATILGMHAACQTDFGPSSRMCTSKEYIHAWVHPEPGLAANQDFSGTLDVVACRDGITSGPIGFWTGLSGPSLTISVNGYMQNNSSCAIPRPVTCCAPAQ